MPASFEMLINNFSVDILGMIIAIIGYFIIREPAKVLFLNNAWQSCYIYTILEQLS